MACLSHATMAAWLGALLFVPGRAVFHRGIGAAGNDDKRGIGQALRQCGDSRNGKADRAADRRRWADIGDGKAHCALFEVRLAQHFDRAGDVEQQHARRHDDEDRNIEGLRGVRHAASDFPRPARAWSTVAIRANRPDRTNSVRSRISFALQVRPVASVIGKVSVASPT